MADIASILNVSAEGSELALELYKVAASTPTVTDDFNSLARSISNLCLTIKQVGSLIVEEDRIPSPEAISILEDVLDQGQTAFREVRANVSVPPSFKSKGGDHHPSTTEVTGPSPRARANLHYIEAHISSLRSTLSVILQTLYTAQVIVWTRGGRSTSPQQATATINNQKTQLEALLLEQQLSLLTARKRYERWRDHDYARQDQSDSLVTADDRSNGLKLADVLKYQVRSLTHLNASHSKDEWLAEICAISESHVAILLMSWTQLYRLDEAAREKERQAKQRRRSSQQPTVESDSDDELSKVKLPADGPRVAPGSVNFSSSPFLPIPVPTVATAQKISVSRSTPFTNLPNRSSADLPLPAQNEAISPIAAAAAAEAKDEAEGDIGLGIPWTLRTRDHYWQHVDDKISKTDTEKPASIAYSDRTSWTEISLSWVCKEALTHAKHPHSRLQKLHHQNGKRTIMEPCFRIEKALTFDQIQGLVEHTVDIYRRDKPSPSLKPHTRSFAEHMQSQQQPSQNSRFRHLSSPFPSNLPPTPTFDRSSSMPGVAPTYPPNPKTFAYTPAQQIPIPPYASATQLPVPPNISHFQPGSTYPPFPSSALPQFQQYPYPPYPNPAFTAPGRGAYNVQAQPIPERRRSTKDRDRNRDRDRRDSGASDSEDSPRHRKHRPSSSSSRSHHIMSKKSMMGTLATVGSLAALLEGL